MKYQREFIGETLGTFILVLFGCGSVAMSVLFDAYGSLLQIAMVWGIGVTLAIYLTRHISCAHLNPAVTLAMVISRRMESRKMPIYILGQFIGAFIAALVLYFLFASSITNYELIHNLARGSAESVATAKMFGEYYSIPGGHAVVSMPLAAMAEAFGTFVLVIMVFALTEGGNVGRPDNALAPLFIGLTVTSIICLIAPLTQAGINPARDFSPRMAAWIFGWDQASFPDQSGGFFWVYILAPMVGGTLASLFFVKILESAMKRASEDCSCNKNE